MYQVEKLQCHIGTWCGEGAIRGVTVVAVDAIVLVVEGMMEDFATERRAGEHPLYERLEFHVTVVEFHGDWATELHLVCLESKAKSVIN